MGEIKGIGKARSGLIGYEVFFALPFGIRN